MEKTFKFQSEYGGTVKLWLDVSYYTTNERIYIGLITDEDGFPEPYANVTVNIEGACPDYCGYVDTNHFPEVERLILENGLGEFTGMVGQSGYYSYPLYLFDRDKLREYAPEGMERYEREVLGMEQEKKTEKEQVR